MSITRPIVDLSLVNGEQKAWLPLSDRGLNYGDGLFETLRIVNLQPVLPALHWQRLARGLKRLGFSLPVATIEAQFEQLLCLARGAGLGDGVVKILVTRGAGSRGFHPAEDALPTVVCRWCELPDYSPAWYREGVELVCCDIRLPHRPQLAGLKHLNCLEYVLAAQEVGADPARQGLLLDLDDNLVESVASNLFLVRDGQLQTPKLHRCGVAGTMRAWLLETLESQFQVLERQMPLAALLEADEVFLCNSVFGVVWVKRCGDRSWHRGAITGTIQQRVKKLFHG